MKKIFVLILTFVCFDCIYAQQNQPNISNFNNESIINGASNSNTSSIFSLKYRGIVEIGLASGLEQHGLNFVKLNVINGVQFNPYIYLGFGAGIRIFTDSGTPVVPLFGDIRFNLLNKKVTPYIGCSIGYSFNIDYGLVGIGLMANPSFGVSYKVSPKASIHFGLGYEYQKQTASAYLTYNQYGRFIKSDSVSFNLGLDF